MHFAVREGGCRYKLGRTRAAGRTAESVWPAISNCTTYFRARGRGYELAAAARPALGRAVTGSCALSEILAEEDVLAVHPGTSDTREDAVDGGEDCNEGSQERFHGLPPRRSSLAGAPADGLVRRQGR